MISNMLMLNEKTELSVVMKIFLKVTFLFMLTFARLFIILHLRFSHSSFLITFTVILTLYQLLYLRGLLCYHRTFPETSVQFDMGKHRAMKAVVGSNHTDWNSDFFQSWCYFYINQNFMSGAKSIKCKFSTSSMFPLKTRRTKVFVFSFRCLSKKNSEQDLRVTD